MTNWTDITDRWQDHLGVLRTSRTIPNLAAEGTEFQALQAREARKGFDKFAAKSNAAHVAAGPRLIVPPPVFANRPRLVA